MASIAQVVVRFGVDLKDFTTKMQKATREIQAMGRQMQSTGKNLTRNLTLPIAALGGASVKLAADFDESMTKIQTLVGVSADVVDGFKDSVLDLAGQTAQAPAELADALFTVTSAGLRGAEAMQVLEMAAKGSAIGMGETKEIARAVTAVMQAYGPEVMSAAQAMDILTATVREGNLEASELAPVLGRVVGIASQLGVGFEEVGASIATFTRLGVDSAEAVTGLRGFLSGLISPSQQGADALAQVGMSFEGLRREVDENGLAQTMIKLINTFDGNVEALAAVIPNVRALGAVMGTAGVQGQSYLNIQNNITNSTGILNKAFEDTGKSGAFILKQTLTQLKQIGTDIGSIVLPVVANLAQDVRALFQRFSDLNQGTKETIVKIAAFAAGVGPALYVVGTMITSIGSLTKALRTLSIFLSTNPWFALAGAIGAVVAGIMAYNNINSGFEKSSTAASRALKQEKEELNSLVGVITDANISNDTRNKLIGDLNDKYPDFLKGLDQEKVTNDQLLSKLKEVNKEYENKIVLKVAEEKTEKMIRERIKLQEREAEILKDINEEQGRLENNEGGMFTKGGTYISGVQMAEKAIKELNVALEGNRKAQANVNKEYEEALAFYRSLAGSSIESLDLPGGDSDPGSISSSVSTKERFTAANAGMKGMVPLVQEVTSTVKGMGVEVKNAFGEFEEGASMLPSVFGQVSNAISNVFTDMLKGAKFSIQGVIDVVIRLIARLAAAAVAAAVLSALIPGGAGNLSQGTKAASSFGSLFKNFAGFRADGGPVASGRSYIVGERGPELFTPGASGMITPNHMMGGMAGKVELQVVGNVPITFQPNGSLTAALKQEQIRLRKIGG